MATYTLISSNVLASSAASVTFSSIPATYTDLVLRISARGNNSGTVSDTFLIVFNTTGGTTDSYTRLRGSGSAASSSRISNGSGFDPFNYGGDGSGATASTFGSLEIYIPNYANTSYAKPMSAFTVTENNATAADIAAYAMLLNATGAINSVVITEQSSASFVSGSSFYLYGISNA